MHRAANICSRMFCMPHMEIQDNRYAHTCAWWPLQQSSLRDLCPKVSEPLGSFQELYKLNDLQAHVKEGMRMGGVRGKWLRVCMCHER